MTGMRVISPGVLSLIQDVGRRGFQRFGVSVSGAMTLIRSFSATGSSATS